MAETSAAKKSQTSVGPFSMTDEEGDLAAFQDYLAGLDADALWDVASHLDPEHYPRRQEAARREIARRRLFFVVPYTRFELHLRAFAFVCFSLAVLAALLRVIGDSALEPPLYGRLPFFTDLAVGSPKVARLLLPVVLPLAEAGAAATICTAVAGIFLRIRRRIRADIAATLALAALAILLLTAFARR